MRESRALGTPWELEQPADRLGTGHQRLLLVGLLAVRWVSGKQTGSPVARQGTHSAEEPPTAGVSTVKHLLLNRRKLVCLEAQ